MIESASGLVLRVRPLTETSLIVQWLTPSLGRISTVAKGARRSQSPFRGRLDLLYLADFSFSRSRASELHALREVIVRDTHEFIRREIGFLQQAAYCVGLIELATETETPLESIFELFQNFLDALAKQPPTAALIFGFELKLLSQLGLQPNLSQFRLSPGAEAILNQLDRNDWAGISRLRLHPAQRAELSAFLQRFLTCHLERAPKGRDAALNAEQIPPQRVISKPLKDAALS